jgi:hypothetical protein
MKKLAKIINAGLVSGLKTPTVARVDSSYG